MFVFSTLVAALAVGPSLPLESSRYDVLVTGPYAEIDLTQVFHNDSDRFIEAVYTFPLDGDAAVDDMTIQIGRRLVVGEIRPREEAREAYEQARAEGKAAALTEQQRPNVFTQHVANIPPGESITVHLHVVQPIARIDGAYELVLPLVVGPRFSDASVTDSAAVTPPVAMDDVGIMVDIDVRLEGGLPLASFESPSHEVGVRVQPSPSAHLAGIRPDRDFVLRWTLDTPTPTPVGLLQDGHLVIDVVPPELPDRDQVVDREILWVIDTSGSQQGVPLEMAQSAMRRALAGMDPRDRFQLLSFSDHVVRHTDAPVAATPENIASALGYIDDLVAGGGTSIVSSVYAALEAPADPDRARYVVFLTDGLIGGDREVLAALTDHIGTSKAYTFGLGSGTNRWLLEEMALAGGGQARFVGIDEEPEASVDRFLDVIGQPVLSDITVDWGDWVVEETTPSRLPDLMAGQPLQLLARVVSRGQRPVTVRGRAGGQRFAVEVPVTEVSGTAVGSAWARAKVAELTREEHWGPQDDVRDAIVALALDYRLLTQHTSFVAIEKRVVNPTGELDRVDQAVDLPAGMDYLTSVSRQYTPPGDPLLTVDAPADARSVVAAFPWGETATLRWDEVRQRWFHRFLVPRDAEDGPIDVVVWVRLADGRIERRVQQMVVDAQAEELVAWLEHVDGQTVLTLAAEEPLRTIQVQPVGRSAARVRVNVVQDDRQEHRIVLDGLFDEVEVVVTDRAMNTLIQRVSR